MYTPGVCVPQKKRLKKLAVEGNSYSVLRAMPRKRGGEGGSGAQKRGPAPSPPDAVGANTRRPPHPARLTGALKRKLPTLISLKEQKWML